MLTIYYSIFFDTKYRAVYGIWLIYIILFYFSIFYGLIIGKNRETLKNLEYQTRTRIKIPGPKENNVISKLNIVIPINILLT